MSEVFGTDSASMPKRSPLFTISPFLTVMRPSLVTKYTEPRRIVTTKPPSDPSSPRSCSIMSTWPARGATSSADSLSGSPRRTKSPTRTEGLCWQRTCTRSSSPSTPTMPMSETPPPSGPAPSAPARTTSPETGLGSWRCGTATAEEAEPAAASSTPRCLGCAKRQAAEREARLAAEEDAEEEPPSAIFSSPVWSSPSPKLIGAAAGVCCTAQISPEFHSLVGRKRLEPEALPPAPPTAWEMASAIAAMASSGAMTGSTLERGTAVVQWGSAGLRATLDVT
mmetsp:Transcript_137950/g.440558  ORF Transcript_137950/g.440558 Transcript_137950/m.440558 type:complete len:281 (-) Transcript_137950:3274-4116(-)